MKQFNELKDRQVQAAWVAAHTAADAAQDAQTTEVVQRAQAAYLTAQTRYAQTRYAQTRYAQDLLKARWDAVVAQGATDPGLEGLVEAQVEGLRDQVDGTVDLSGEELDEEALGLLGWTLPATDTQLDQWHTLVDQCAKEWLATQGLLDS